MAVEARAAVAMVGEAAADMKAAPTEEELGFVPPEEEDFAPGDALVERRLLYYWEGVGWCEGVIEERNKAEGPNGATHGWTKFIDLTPAEFKSKYLGSHSPKARTAEPVDLPELAPGEAVLVHNPASTRNSVPEIHVMALL